MLLNKTNDCLRNSIGYPLKEDGTICVFEHVWSIAGKPRSFAKFDVSDMLIFSRLSRISTAKRGFNHLLYSEKRRAQKDDLRLKVSIIARLPPKFR
jgi:hypothetical protein